MTLDALSDHTDDLFVAKYVHSSAHFAPGIPALDSSLRVFDRMGEAREALAALRGRVSCLLQGYTAPQNVDALRRRLSKAGVALGDIVAVDLLDLPRIYDRLGVGMPDVDFLQGDACDLSARIADALFNIVIQDFTLNCLPPMMAPDLLREARRVLKADGFAMISFTDATGLCERPLLTASDAMKRHGVEWTPTMRGLMDAAGSASHFEELAAGLMGATLTCGEQGQLAFVTRPFGRFEFFAPAETTFDMLRDEGFHCARFHRSIGIDPAGLQCVRYRCLLRPI